MASMGRDEQYRAVYVRARFPKAMRPLLVSQRAIKQAQEAGIYEHSAVRHLAHPWMRQGSYQPLQHGNRRCVCGTLQGRGGRGPHRLLDRRCAFAGRHSRGRFGEGRRDMLHASTPAMGASGFWCETARAGLLFVFRAHPPPGAGSSKARDSCAQLIYYLSRPETLHGLPVAEVARVSPGRSGDFPRLWRGQALSFVIAANGARSAGR